MANVNHQLRKSLGLQKFGSGVARNSGTVWPNGEFSYGTFYEVGLQDEGNEWLWCQDVDEPSFRWETGVQPECEGYFTSSNALNSHKRQKYGISGITGHGRKMVRSGCSLLERRLGKADVAFCTLTVPTLNREARIRLAMAWGDLMRELIQWLSRRLAKSGRPTAIIGCTEIQSGRLHKYAQGYLHAHLCWPAFSNGFGRYAVDVRELREWWKKALERKAKTTLPVYPRVELVPVRKSVEAYLSKYMSKGTGDELQGFIEDLGPESVPGQWWHCSKAMRDAIKNNMSHGVATGDALDSMIQSAFEDGDFEVFEYIRHIERPIDGKLVTIGWVGKLKEPYRQKVLRMLAKGDVWSTF